MGKRFDPEAEARARNAAVLAGAGVDRPGYSNGAGFGPPGMQGGIAPQMPQRTALNPVGDFASDYSDPLLGSVPGQVAPTRVPSLPGGELLLSGQVECPECHARQPAGQSKCTTCGKDLALSQPPTPTPESELLLSEEQEGHAVSLYDTLQLAKKSEDGLVWKAICKTGELALSPGPGQIDVDKPLKLTRNLFEQLVLSVEEQAFPYVTIPTTHANGLLENTGYVKQLAIEPSADPTDPDGTDVLWAAMDFTEPDIAAKIERGTIPDTSVGVKFGYRNKRTGKTYPAALEHVALTHQPWVDGLTPFGAGLSQEGIFDGAETEPEWEGVYMSAAAAEPEPTDILPEDLEIDGIPASFFSAEPMRTSRKHTRQADPALEARRRAAAAANGAEIPDTVEELLATQQVEIEQERQRNSELELRLAQNEGRVASQADTMHLANVQAQVTEWENAKLPPAWIKEAKDILLAAGPPPAEVTEDNAILTLSITKESEDEGGTPQVVEQHMSVQDVVKRLALAVPRFAPGMGVTEVMQSMDELNAAQPNAGSEKSPSERAEAILEQAESHGGTVI